MIELLLAAWLNLRVIDGDTFVLDDERIRIENIDAPELRKPRCEWERQLAEISRDILDYLLRSGRLEVFRSGRDLYGRTLARVSVNGRDVGEQMIEAKLAGPWPRTAVWCP